MFGFNKKNGNAQSGGDKPRDINEAFMLHYAPYTVPSFKFKVRDSDDIPPIDDPDAKRLAILARTVDEQREKDPYIGAKLAGKEIYANLIEMLKTEKGVHIESLLAVIGAVGGYECMSGIMTALDAVLAEGNTLAGAGGALSILVADTMSGEKYLFGDCVGNEFCMFCMNAAKASEPPLSMLKPLSELAAKTAGSHEYWATPFNSVVGTSPKALSEMFRGKFETTFSVFCVYPQERVIAMAIAAQLAVEQAANVMGSDGLSKAMSIIAEFGWRTSHYIGD
ncbi:MAG: hypothetical protein K2J80_13450 [Oscillospiraceae bacterium]|nr:hypothetical protein [Oscillospiraceae bacterium]